MLQCDIHPSTCNGRPTLAAVVVNVGSEVVPSVEVFWGVEYDTAKWMPAFGPVPAGLELGREVSFVLPDGATRRDIEPGGRAVYYLHPAVLDEIALSQIASLSPECLRVFVRSGNLEVMRATGAVFGSLLIGLEEPPVGGT